MADQAAPARIAGLPPGVAPGPLGTRFVAYLIDNVVPVVISLLGGVVILRTNLSPTAVGLVTFVLLLGWAVLVWWMFAVRGAGPGMRLMHLELVGLSNGRPIGWGRFLLRQLILTGLALTGIGLLLMVIFLVRQPRRQGWHDLAVNSVVIRERQGARLRGQARHAMPAKPERDAAARGYPTPPVSAQPPQPAPQAPTPPPQVMSPLAPPLTPPALTQPPSLTPPPGTPPSRPQPPARQAEPSPPPAGVAAPPAGPTRPGAYVPAAPLGGGKQPPNQSPDRPWSQGSAPPPATGAAASAQEASGGRWRAVLDDGRELEIEGLVLLGRNPQPRPGEEHAALIKIADTTRTVSKSHLELGIGSAGLYVVDRGSTNGSTVTTVSGVSRRCAPGEAITVEPGSIVSFGDHWLEIRRD